MRTYGFGNCAPCMADASRQYGFSPFYQPSRKGLAPMNAYRGDEDVNPTVDWKWILGGVAALWLISR